MELCDVWVCFDVLCCTASILHLIAIAMDRYWAVTSIDYIHNRTARRIIYMIVAVWVSSVVISIPARFHIHRSSEEWVNVMIYGQCRINDGYGYTIFSTVGAFYLPMAFMICIYVRIYQTARNRIRKRTFVKKETKCKGSRHNYQNSSSYENNNNNNNNSTHNDRHCHHHHHHHHHKGSKKNNNNNNNAGFEQRSSRQASKKSLRRETAPLSCESMVCPPMATSLATAETMTGFPSTTLDSSSCGGYLELSGGRAWCLEDLNDIRFVDDSSDEDEEDVSEEGLGGEEETEAGTSTAMTPLYQASSSLRDYLSEESTPALYSLEGGGCGGPSASAPAVPVASKPPNSQTGSKREGTERVPLYTREMSNSSLKRTEADVGAMTTTSSCTAAALVTSSFTMTAAGVMSSDETTTEDQTLRRRAARMESMREKLEQKRERKAARTLAIITGCFLLCWLPFCISALVVPFCGDQCPLPDPVNSFFLWLGYLNSLLNPVIYTIFSPDFRNAFRKILFGRYHTHKRR